MDLNALIVLTLNNNASDLHVSAGLAPLIRVDGELRQLTTQVLDHQAILTLLYSIMNDKQRLEYETELETDFSFEFASLARFRVNVFHHARGIGAVFRVIPANVPSMEDLNLPCIFTELLSFSQGLMLITGPTGSGKTTTLASMIDYINASRHQHILTIEDPIEFIHTSQQCLVHQREVHRDTHSFSVALRSGLREDPDIILVGELRDLETIRLAMTAAETGHLVFATLHTNSATKTINRIIDVFPASEKAMVRTMLSESLQAVVSQRLIKKKSGGRVAALEIMVCNAAIRHLIREDKVAQMYSVIQTGQAQGTLLIHVLLCRPHDGGQRRPVGDNIDLC